MASIGADKFSAVAVANFGEFAKVQAMNEIALPKTDVVGVGVNAVDTLIALPRFPASDSKLEFFESRVMPGGQVASAMVACQKWGLQTRYVGKVGDDAYGELHRKEFAAGGVEAHLIVEAGCASQSSFILVDQSSGERTVLWKRDPRVALKPEELKREWVSGARALLVDGHDTAAAGLAARWAREEQIPVTADLDNIYPGVEALLENVDFVVCSKEFPTRLTGEKRLPKSLPDIKNRFKSQLVAATLGREGVLAWNGSTFTYFPAYLVNAVDTTGAGDIFHAAFVYAQLAGWEIEEQLSFSCAAAALNCTAAGARGNIAKVDEIHRLMRGGATHPDAYPTRRFSA
jgi:sulfofructose kinase